MSVGADEYRWMYVYYLYIISSSNIPNLPKGKKSANNNPFPIYACPSIPNAKPF
jgi:hypothetical protein